MQNSASIVRLFDDPYMYMYIEVGLLESVLIGVLFPEYLLSEVTLYCPYINAAAPLQLASSSIYHCATDDVVQSIHWMGNLYECR